MDDRGESFLPPHLSRVLTNPPHSDLPPPQPELLLPATGAAQATLMERRRLREPRLPADCKTLLRSLVEAHHEEAGFDDFVKGKGVGLVVNLFEPPGARPSLPKRRASTSWKAIVLIDEADVFLERPSLHDLERNAMVAVFFRHVEYYRGILFTTNRVQAFDEAFLSRIHVALHFGELSEASCAQVWRAFVARTSTSTTGGMPTDEAQSETRGEWTTDQERGEDGVFACEGAGGRGGAGALFGAAGCDG
ncbi:hypothetical protein DFH08DRAFT_1082466 [Mycena albidolilacea]|uniref:ATPase AAA-type core domain-containing protein n=1 Tax=Mycena albidolilacea TaxID=1033008 RepID=A0AAD6ZUF9_9AGAR|nr:hypothetical protein DFH08DRAFT_1082466 [Mycena albidolilacea]